MSKILIIKHGSLGDIAQASGAIQDISEFHKEHDIYLLTTKPYFELFKRNPHLKSVILDKRLSRFNLIYLFLLMRTIKKYKFVKVFDLQNSSRTAFYKRILFPNANHSIWSSSETTLPADKSKEELINLIKNQRELEYIRLVIMGVDFGFQDQMLEIIDKFNIKEKIHVIKNPSREDVVTAYRESEFLVLPSRWELSPLTPLEGFAFKKTVISTNVHGIPSTITHGENGVLIEDEDFHSLAKAILELINDKQKCSRYGLSGFNLVQQECNSKSMGQKTLKIYNQVVNR